MYLQNDLKFKIRSDLYFDTDSIDTLFVEIEQTSSKNMSYMSNKFKNDVEYSKLIAW